MAVDAGPAGEAGAAAGQGAPAVSPHPVLAAIKVILDVGGQEELPQELEEAALDAGGLSGLGIRGW
jgi:hypothetical protein